MRNFSFEFWPDLVSTFQYLTVNWKVTSSHIGLKTFLMDPVLENKSLYFRHDPFQQQKNENQDLGSVLSEPPQLQYGVKKSSFS